MTLWMFGNGGDGDEDKEKEETESEPGAYDHGDQLERAGKGNDAVEDPIS